VQQAVDMAETRLVAMVVAEVVAVVLAVNGITNMDLAMTDLQQDLVVQDHKVVMELLDTQEQVAVVVLHLELLVTLA
jgi:hypothetical protein